MEKSFSFFFNRRKQWVNVTLWDVHPKTFANWNYGRWGYWFPTWINSCSGLFGELHFVKSRLRIDTISHELSHLREEWIWANRQSWDGRSEERLVEFSDRLLWGFLRELSKIEPKTRKWMKNLGEL